MTVFSQSAREAPLCNAAGRLLDPLDEQKKELNRQQTGPPDAAPLA